MALPSTTPNTVQQTSVAPVQGATSNTVGYFGAPSYTELPQWYNTATQNALNLGINNATSANAAANNANVNIANAVNNLNEGINTQTGNLNQISGGAANPWLANGQANTQTAFGQLFQNQQNQLNSVLPDIQAGADAAGIASGNFGGLRGLTAGNTARAKAANDLAVQQSQAWNQAQTTGVNAANAAVNAGQTGVQGALSAGNFGVNAPLNVAGALGNLLSGTKVGSYNISGPSQAQIDQYYSALNSGGGYSVFAHGGKVKRYAPGGALPMRKPLGANPSNRDTYMDKRLGANPSNRDMMGEVPPEEIQRMRDEQQQRMMQEAYRRSQFANQRGLGANPSNQDMMNNQKAQGANPSILEQIFMGGRR